MRVLIVVGILGILFFPLLAKGGRLPDWGQCNKGNFESNPCPVSFYTLIANPEIYDDKYVKFIGYYPSSGARVVYLNEGAAISGDFMSSLLLDSVQNEGCGYYEVTGLFKYETKDSGLAPGIYRSYGAVHRVKFSLPSHGVRRGCDLDVDSVFYLNGVVPVRREK